MAKEKKNIYGRIMKLFGWQADSGAAPEQKCIILGVPHTSIADFLVAYFYYKSLGHIAHVMIKKVLFFWPLGPILRKFGCIPVDRSNGAAVVRSVIEEMQKAKGEFHLCIAPEGTRKPVKRWKMGYHSIAKALDCPVYLGYFNWGNKHISIGERFICSDDARADTALIQQKYEALHLVGKNPEGYVTH